MHSGATDYNPRFICAGLPAVIGCVELAFVSFARVDFHEQEFIYEFTCKFICELCMNSRICLAEGAPAVVGACVRGVPGAAEAAGAAVAGGRQRAAGSGDGAAAAVGPNRQPRF